MKPAYSRLPSIVCKGLPAGPNVALSEQIGLSKSGVCIGAQTFAPLLNTWHMHQGCLLCSSCSSFSEVCISGAWLSASLSYRIGTQRAFQRPLSQQHRIRRSLSSRRPDPHTGIACSGCQACSLERYCFDCNFVMRHQGISVSIMGMGSGVESSKDFSRLLSV